MAIFCFTSQVEFDKNREEILLALSTCSALSGLAARRTEEGAESPHACTLGFIPPSGLSKHGVNSYQLSDAVLLQVPIARPSEIPPWMAIAAPKASKYVREMDLVHLETMQRE